MSSVKKKNNVANACCDFDFVYQEVDQGKRCWVLLHRKPLKIFEDHEKHAFVGLTIAEKTTRGICCFSQEVSLGHWSHDGMASHFETLIYTESAKITVYTLQENIIILLQNLCYNMLLL